MHDLLSYHAILTCSGDGVIHEIINSILNRPDKEFILAQNIPIGPLPAGSGNGLFSSICASSGEKISLAGILKIICAGFIKKADLIEVRLENER